MKKSLYILSILVFTSTSILAFEKESDHRSKVSSKEKEEKQEIPLSEFKTFDIGKNIQKGTTTFKDSIIEIVASGRGFGGEKDEGYFIFMPIKGNFEFSVRVHSLSESDLLTKAGIMARLDLGDNSKNISFFILPENKEEEENKNFELQYRFKRGGNSEVESADINEKQITSNFPNRWIKLERNGNTFSAFLSTDNINWELYSSYVQKMPKRLLVGLAVSSNNKNGYTRAEFSELQINNKKYY